MTNDELKEMIRCQDDMLIKLHQAQKMLQNIEKNLKWQTQNLREYFGRSIPQPKVDAK